jgi:hypothetical protein
MHKLYEYVCDELKDLEKKAEKGNLSMQEVQYADTLAHLKKNLMKADEMMEDEFGEYSMAYYPMTSYAEEGGMHRSYAGRRSYAPRRDAMGRYSRRGYSMANEETVSDLHAVMNDTTNEHIRSEIKKLIDRIETM